MADGKTVIPGDDLAGDDVTQDVGGGSFTQAQVNAIVQDRLARQKRAMTADFQVRLTRLAELETENAALKEKTTRYADVYTKGLADRKKNLPAGVLKLLDGLDPVEQGAWLDENADTLTVKPRSAGPQTPKPDDKPTSDNKTDVGKTSQAGIYYGI